MRKYFAFGLILLGIIISVPGFSNAQSAEKIERFESVISIAKENSVTITETITYDFGSAQRHGIYRNIPVEYKEGSDTYNLAFDHISTQDEHDKKVTTDVSSSNGNKVLKIGDADKTITGKHVYKITYKLWPIITSVDGKARLLLDVNGNGWQVPTSVATAKVTLEDGASLQDSKCFTGVVESTEQRCVITENGTAFYTQGLAAGENMTLTATLPDNYVDSYLVANKMRPLTKDDFIMFGVVALGVAAGAAALGVYGTRRLRIRNRRKRQTIVPEYEAPLGLVPAEIGLLQDDVSSTKELTATLIDLGVRGYIKITQDSPKKWYKKAEYSLTKLRAYNDVCDFEKPLLEELFKNGDTIALKDIDAASMAAVVAAMHAKLKERLQAKNYYAKVADEPNVLEKMLDGGAISDTGAEAWAKVEGFREYLGVVEKDRLDFTDAPEKTPERFSALLPYAVALGVEKEWAKQFEGIDIAPATNGWYSGGATPYFAAAALTSDLSSGFASAVASNSTVDTSSGGGSSGGGFGGGGGGSW